MSTEKSEIKERIRQFFHSMDTQNYELMKDLLPHEEHMVHIGTDKDEIWIGRKDLLIATREQFEGLKYYKADIHNLHIKLSQDENSACYFHLLDAEIKSVNGTTKWKNARFTGMVEKRDGKWILLQTHVSLPESNHSG